MEESKAEVEHNNAESSVGFSARLDSARVVSVVLSCLSHGSKKAQHAQCEATPESFTVIVAGRAKFTQVGITPCFVLLALNTR